MSDSKARSGYVALVGRPNVGKSTILNHILGQKISITSRKPQTTRHRVLGIKTEGDFQTMYVDTPGLHRVQKKAINRYMNKAASSSIKEVDVIVFVVDKLQWTDEDEMVVEQLKQARSPVILAINKIDQIDDKGALLPHLQMLSSKLSFSAVVPISALDGHNLENLEAEIGQLLPLGMHFFPEDQITDRSSRFLAAEIVREKIMRQLGDELPYEMTVEIETFEDDGEIITINALILVERDSQKSIVIGKGGKRLKLIGQEARRDMERMFDGKVMLKTWVKVKGGWSDDERALRSLGYDDL
ncbi:GTP-binding protein Era [Sinobacterium caligoides]|uniref:GTPase Era n=1 Tax=Sinobacterium caligoides TaxID=933926 RepID=A0A3N2DY52_9GAMM|nr:GTPase Era [Sinobacterium caligoides]ROS04714.1 GTP-binding protein Era [Sinobacterium caligoides]